MSSAEEGSLSGRALPQSRSVSRAIPIPNADSYSDSDGIEAGPAPSSDYYAASPGVESYVAGDDSWRPVPPPMLASSLEPRFQPHLRPPPSDEPAPPPLAAFVRPPPAPSYGTVPAASASVDAAAPPAEKTPAAVLHMERKRRRARRSAQVSEDAPAPGSIRAKLDRAIAQAGMLRNAPRELWLIYALKFLTSYAYFSLSIVLTMYLTDEFGLSDTAAGWAYGAYGVMSTFFGLLCGWFIDYLGVRASLLVGALVGAASRFVMALTTSRYAAILMLYTFLPFAECLGIPIMTIGIKRYTNANNRTFAFSLFYSMMNLAALCAGPLVDLFRGFFRDGVTIHLALLGHDIRLTGLRLIILSGAVTTAAVCIVVFIGIREIHVDDTGNLSSFTPNRESPMQQTMAVLREPAFWRLTVFTLLLVGVRLVFRHLDATMPKYLVRQFGPNAPFGMIYAINPFLIIILVPMIGLVTRHIDSFSMILSGSFVAAASPFWLCMKQSYVSVVLFMVTLSLGEAVYSPRVYEYTMEVSAHGSEGLYSSLSSAPLFSVKLLVGGMSGWLLTAFMPANGPHHGNILWGIVGITSLTSPILMCILREYICPSAQAEELSSGGESREQVESPKGIPPDAMVSSARPPTGRSAAIRITTNNYEEDDVGDDADDEALLSSSHRGKSPLSLPPITSAHNLNIAGVAPQSPSQQSRSHR